MCMSYNSRNVLWTNGFFQGLALKSDRTWRLFWSVMNYLVPVQKKTLDASQANFLVQLVQFRYFDLRNNIPLFTSKPVKRKSHPSLILIRVDIANNTNTDKIVIMMLTTVHRAIRPLS